MRRKGKYASQTFRLKTHASEWIVETERLVDIGSDPVSHKVGNPRTIADLIELHIADLLEVGKPIRRSKRAVLNALKSSLGTTRISNLDRAALIKFGKKRAKQGAGPVTLAVGLSYKRSRFSPIETSPAQGPQPAPVIVKLAMPPLVNTKIVTAISSTSLRRRAFDVRLWA